MSATPGSPCSGPSARTATSTCSRTCTSSSTIHRSRPSGRPRRSGCASGSPTRSSGWTTGPTPSSTSRGEERDIGLHELRKAAKRARYAAEAVVPLFGKDAARAASRAEALQDVLGEHQDSVRSQEALRQLGVTAHLSGENGFSFGVLVGAERQRAAEADAAHDEVYRRTATKKARRWLQA